MKKFYLLPACARAGKVWLTRLQICLLVCLLFSIDSFAQCPIPGGNCDFLKKIGGIASTNGAEISAFDPGSNRIYTVAGPVIEYSRLKKDGTITLLGSLPLGFTLPATDSALPNSVAIHDGKVAASFAIIDKVTRAQKKGRVTFYNADNAKVIRSVVVGYLPDMVVFTPDGKRVLTANEGEPNGYGQPDSFDPEGSVSIIRIQNGIQNASVQQVSFASFNGQEAALRAKGIRIYGPGASAAQDFEPEYIAFSPDGKKAWVTLQENNAFAVIDIAAGNVSELIPLGLKDHSKPTVLGLETFAFENMPSIGTTAAGQRINLGGFSGLVFEGYAANGNLKFVTHTDRGPNGEPTGQNRPFALPGFTPELVRFELNRASRQVALTQRIQLKYPDGRLLTGLPNINLPGGTEASIHHDETGKDLFNNTLAVDPLAADLEGVVIAPDGSFWMVDEYRPAIYHFDTSGVLIKRFVPEGAAVAAGQPAGTYGTEALPSIIAQRRQNRGFEGVAYQDGKIYAFVQSPIRNPVTTTNATLNGWKYLRVIEFDPATESTTGQFIYVMDNIPPATGSPTDSRADKLGDAVAIGNGEFLVLERDDDAIDSDPLADIQKKIYRFSFSGATNVNALPNVFANGKTIEQMTIAELAASGVVPVSKYLHVDLALAGYNTTEKVEGLTIVDCNTLAVINDNDFTVGGLTFDATTGLFNNFPNPNGEKPLLGLLNLRNNGLDANDRDVTGSSGGGGKISIRHWPVFGMYEPDAIASFSIKGKGYYITANEGDARDWPGYAEEQRVGDAAYILDPVLYPNAANLKQNINLGRLTATSANGSTDADPEFEQIHILGGRSFSIWDADGKQVFDSGDELEQLTAALAAESFNSDGTPASFDTRSDNKGPEIEAVTIGVIDGVTYAFVGSERTGDIFVYDVSDPSRPEFIQYINTPEDLGVEGLQFVPAKNSPTSKPLLIVSAEVSRTVAIFEVNKPVIAIKEASGKADDGDVCAGTEVILTASGSGPFLWSTGATTQSIRVSPSKTTDYTVKVCGLKASETIRVIPAPRVTIVPIPLGWTYTGGEPTNIYLGYGPQSVTLAALSSSLFDGSCNYLWSGGPLSNYRSPAPVFTARTAGQYTFTVKVTNRQGCETTESITICVTDIRVPGHRDKVYLCHDGRTITVSENAVPSHLFAHRKDRLGKCDQESCTPASASMKAGGDKEPVASELTVTAYPNPSDLFFTLNIQGQQSVPVDITVTDTYGRRLVSTRTAAKGTIRLGQDFKPGTYIVEVRQGDQRKVIKLLKR